MDVRKEEEMGRVNGWFDVSRAGLRQLMDGRPKSFLVRELVQNCWDEPGVTNVVVELEHQSKGVAKLVVKDDAPEGFHDITHAYTLFAETRKRKDPTKRGRFNLGEKQVLALCKQARIATTTGTILFDADGTRTRLKAHTVKGSIFYALVRMNKGEIEECIQALRSFIPPKGITTFVNGSSILEREPLAVREAKLTTEYTDGGGTWRRSRRKTVIDIHETMDGEVPTLYEMGIPVVELEGGDCFHYNVDQRVPLNQDRDNVSPAYLRDLRGEVINVVADELTAEQAAEPWVREATDGDRIGKEAFETVIHKRFGDKVASVSVDDPEANHAAASQGYTVLSGGSMTRGEWANAKRFEAVASAHAVAPTKHPEFSPDGVDTTIPEEKWTEGMRRVVTFIRKICDRIIDGGMRVRVVRDKWNRFSGWYGGGAITVNLSVVGHKFFNQFPANMSRVVDFVVHEAAHRFEANHLSDAYHKALTRMAGQLVELALEEPELFEGK